jgi:ATP-dependent RNA helicase DDX42
MLHRCTRCLCICWRPCCLFLLLQVVEVLHDASSKQQWLLGRLQQFVDDGDVLIFANQKARVDELSAALLAAGAK